MAAELSEEAREFFREQGRIGGLKGDASKKGCAGSLERSRAMAEINRTRRKKMSHPSNCWCDFCRRWWAAKAKLKELKAGK